MNTGFPRKLVGLTVAGLTALSFLITLGIGAYQLHFQLPYDAYSALNEAPWAEMNVRTMRFEEAADFTRAKQRLHTYIKEAAANANPTPDFLLGSLHHTLAQNKEAAYYYKRAIERTQGQWYQETVFQYLLQDAHAALAEIYYKGKDFPAAKTELAKAGNVESMEDGPLYTALQNVLEDPSRADYHFELGQAYRDNLRLEDARREIAQALELSEDPVFHQRVENYLLTEMPAHTRDLSPITRYQALAGSYFGEEDRLRSVACLERVIRANPEFEWSYITLGNVYRDMRKYPQARKYAEIATKLNPKSHLAYTTLGDLALDEENYLQAVTHFSRAREILAPYSDSYHRQLLANIEVQLGFSHELLENPTAANRHYSSALALAPEESEDYEYAATAMNRLKEHASVDKKLYSSR